jgi:excisionase family DNA binding protein
MEAKKPPKEPGASDGLAPRTAKKLCSGVKELANRLSVSRGLIYKEIKAGRLRPIKVGRRTLFVEEEIRRYLADRGAGAEGDFTMSWSMSDYGYPLPFIEVAHDLEQRRSYLWLLVIACAAALAAIAGIG